MITAERLRELLNYDPETGIFTWREMGRGRNRNGRGLIAGCESHTSSGVYLTIGIDRKIYYANVLAYLFMTGEHPKGLVDHIDRNGLNNKWSNLREANKASNAWNARKAKRCSSSGYIGVSEHRKGSGRWYARIRVNGPSRFLGSFDSPEEAAMAYDHAAKELHGEFAEVNFK